MTNKEFEQTEQEIREEVDIIAEFLIEKNRAYGDSALNPKRFFAKGDAEELILSRIDDKLNRIFQGKPEGEDPLKDLVGYYILLQIAKKRRQKKTEGSISRAIDKIYEKDDSDNARNDIRAGARRDKPRPAGQVSGIASLDDGPGEAE